MLPKIDSYDTTPRFDKALKGAPPDIKRAVASTIDTLLQNPNSNTLRAHPLKGYAKPQIWKIDVLGHSWQITLEIHGSQANLVRLGTHRQLDRRVR
jgi:hypothetical protein